MILNLKLFGQNREKLNMGYCSDISVQLQDVVMRDLRIFEGIEGLVWEGKLIVDNDIEIKVGNSGRGAPNIYKAKTTEARAALKRLKHTAALALSMPDNEECLDWFTAYMDDGDNAEMHITAIAADMRLNMQTLADLKRRMKVGTKIRKIGHIDTVVGAHTPHPSGVREVKKVQSNSWALGYPEDKKDFSWLDIPKASELEFDGNKFTITTWEGTLQMTYEIIDD
jgi:hypothetical protein